MNNSSPIDLLFGGMEKLGPGGDEDTLKVLDMLPPGDHDIIVDAGCGTGRQTLVLARRILDPLCIQLIPVNLFWPPWSDMPGKPESNTLCKRTVLMSRLLIRQLASEGGVDYQQLQNARMALAQLNNALDNLVGSKE